LFKGKRVNLFDIKLLKYSINSKYKKEKIIKLRNNKKIINKYQRKDQKLKEEEEEEEEEKINKINRIMNQNWTKQKRKRRTINKTKNNYYYYY
jgi:hypothetical protein